MPVSLVSSISKVHVAVRGATATHWAPPTGSVTSEQDSASASQASPASIVTDVKATTLALALKAVNPVTVILRARVPCSARRMATVSARKASWGAAATSVRRTISTTAHGQAARNVQPVID